MHNLRGFFYHFSSLFTENHFLIAAINLVTRGPLYTCLVTLVFHFNFIAGDVLYFLQQCLWTWYLFGNLFIGLRYYKFKKWIIYLFFCIGDTSKNFVKAEKPSIYIILHNLKSSWYYKLKDAANTRSLVLSWPDH